MEADYIYNYKDAQNIEYPRLKFVQRASSPGFGIFQPYGAGAHVILELARVGLNEDGLVLARYAMSCDPWKDVIDFHVKFGQDYDGPPRKLEESLNIFRQKFMCEEHGEFMDAPDDKHRLDAICDYIYVALGYCRLRGWNFPEAWRRVQEANMTKRLATENDIKDKKARHVTDIVKPMGFVPPDHSDLVEIK